MRLLSRTKFFVRSDISSSISMILHSFDLDLTSSVKFSSSFSIIENLEEY